MPKKRSVRRVTAPVRKQLDQLADWSVTHCGDGSFVVGAMADEGFAGRQESGPNGRSRVRDSRCTIGGLVPS